MHQSDASARGQLADLKAPTAAQGRRRRERQPSSLTTIGRAASVVPPVDAANRPGSLEGGEMQCPRCQQENPTGMRFCGQCAAPLASVCPSCGAPNPPENKFCGQCAGPLVKSAQPRVASPDSY